MDRVEPRARLALAPFAAVPAETLYGILRLRAEVFVVEQECVYLDLDGRDVEPSTLHVWVEAGGVVACARVLVEPTGSSVGRVVCAAAWRSRGIGAAVVRSALEVAARPVAINAQAHLVDWYATFGFEVSGEGFVEDGIPHVPMVLR